MRWNLFANGEFRVKNPEWGKDVYDLTIHRLSEIIKYNKLKGCTLIARPISDMTSNELSSLIYKEPGYPIDWDNARQGLIEGAKGQILSYREVQQMLDVGVYPFDQSHFDDGTVIDAKKMEKA